MIQHGGGVDPDRLPVGSGQPTEMISVPHRTSRLLRRQILGIGGTAPGWIRGWILTSRPLA